MHWWQRDLAIGVNKIGDVLLQTRASLEAPRSLSYRQRLAIAQKLADSDPGNADWQRDLAIATNKIGTVMAAPSARARRRSQRSASGHRHRAEARRQRFRRRRVAARYLHHLVQYSATCCWPRARPTTRWPPTARVLAIAERLVASDPGNARTGNASLPSATARPATSSLQQK